MPIHLNCGVGGSRMSTGSRPALVERVFRLPLLSPQSQQRPPRQPNPNRCTSAAIGRSRCSRSNPKFEGVQTQNRVQQRKLLKAQRDTACPETPAFRRCIHSGVLCWRFKVRASMQTSAQRRTKVLRLNTELNGPSCRSRAYFHTNHSCCLSTMLNNSINSLYGCKNCKN